MPPGINANNASASLDAIYATKALYDADLISKHDAEVSIGEHFGNLISSDDVTPEIRQEATEILDRITSEPPPTTGGIFNKLKRVITDLRGKSETFEKTAPPATREGLEKLKKDAALAKLPYTNELSGEGYNPELTTRLAYQVDVAVRQDLESTDPGIKRGGIAGKDNQVSRWGGFVDSKSGLAANIVVDSAKKEVKVIFGGTTSGDYKNSEVNNYSFLKRSRNNAVSTLSQWVSNIKAGLGIKPHSLVQAENLTRKIVQVVQSDRSFSGYSVSTIGHSKGASEAIYAALAQTEPLHAVGFSSADLGGRLVRGLPKENVARAKELISHYHVKADLVPNLRFITPSLRPLGRETVIPASSTLTSPLSRHDAFANHIELWVDQRIAQLES